MRDVRATYHKTQDHATSLSFRAIHTTQDIPCELSNLQVHTIAGLIYPCIYTTRTAGGSPSYDQPMIHLKEENSQYVMPVKKKPCGVCTIILSADRMDVKKIKSMSEEVDLHIFTGVDPRDFPNIEGVHHVTHVNQLNMKDLVDAGGDESLKDYLKRAMTTDDGNSNLGLYDFIDTLKVVLLHFMLKLKYDFVAYQDFSKVEPVNKIITCQKVQRLVNHFGILYGAGFEPEVNVFLVSHHAKEATKKTVEQILSLEGSLPWSTTGRLTKSRPMHILRYRSAIGVRLIRTLFHLRNSEEVNNPKSWFDMHMYLPLQKPLCSKMLVNSMQDIVFAMKVLSMRCIASWMLPHWKGAKTNDAADMQHMYNYTHNVLMRQWFFWSHEVFTQDMKVYDLLDQNHEELKRKRGDGSV